MSISKSSPDHARQVVDLHTRGVICAGEVWGQFVDHTTRETFALFMAQLTPELQQYSRYHVFVHYHDLCSSVRERQALAWLSDYYEKHDA